MNPYLISALAAVVVYFLGYCHGRFSAGEFVRQFTAARRVAAPRHMPR